jgi:hypothetical protein
LRRLEKVNIEALFAVAGQNNVKRLLAFGGHRPRKLAQEVAALRLREPKHPTLFGPASRGYRRRTQRWLRSNPGVFQQAGTFLVLLKKRAPRGAGYFSGSSQQLDVSEKPLL